MGIGIAKLKAWIALFLLFFSLETFAKIVEKIECEAAVAGEALESAIESPLVLIRPAESTRGWSVIPPEQLFRYGAIYGASDLHGQYQKAQRLFQRHRLVDRRWNWIGGKSLLLITGDMINKGPDSVQLLLWIMKLQRQGAGRGGKVIVTLGNHEGRFLAAADRDQTELGRSAAWHRLSNSDRKKILDWLNTLPLGAFVGDAFFCHSGYLTRKNFEKGPKALGEGRFDAKRIAGRKSILEARRWQDDGERIHKILRASRALGVRTILFGHQTHALGRPGIIKSADDFFVCLDPDWERGPGSLFYAPSAAAFSAHGVSEASRLTARGNVKQLHETSDAVGEDE